MFLEFPHEELSVYFSVQQLVFTNTAPSPRPDHFQWVRVRVQHEAFTNHLPMFSATLVSTS